MYNLIACVNKCGLLGQENDLYSTSGKDLMNFSMVTKGHNIEKENVVVMGYNTWISLPHKPLPKRHNIILSKNNLDKLDIGLTTMTSLKETFTYLDHNVDRFGEVFIIGGASIYEQCLLNYPDQLNKMYITELEDEWLGNDDSKYFHYGSMLSRMSLLKETIDICPTRIYDPHSGEYIIKDLQLTFKIYQNKEMINHDEVHYLHLMNSIMNNGIDNEGRNGSTKSSFGEKMTFDLSSFPLLTTKKMGYKTIL